MMCTCLKKRWKRRKVSVGCGGSSADSQNVSSHPCLQKRKPVFPGHPRRPASVLLSSEQGAGAAAGAGVALPRPPGDQCRGGTRLGAPSHRLATRRVCAHRVQHHREQLPPTHLTEPSPCSPHPQFPRKEGSLAARPPQPRGPAREF